MYFQEPFFQLEEQDWKLLTQLLTTMGQQITQLHRKTFY